MSPSLVCLSSMNENTARKQIGDDLISLSDLSELIPINKWSYHHRSWLIWLMGCLRKVCVCVCVGQPHKISSFAKPLHYGLVIEFINTNPEKDLEDETRHKSVARVHRSTDPIRLERSRGLHRGDWLIYGLSRTPRASLQKKGFCNLSPPGRIIWALEGLAVGCAHEVSIHHLDWFGLFAIVEIVNEINLRGTLIRFRDAQPIELIAHTS